MFTHILSTIPHIRLTGLSVEGITVKKHTHFFQASPVWYGAIMKMAFIAGQPGVQIIGFSEQHRLEQPHKDLETSPTTDPHHPAPTTTPQGSQKFTVSALSKHRTHPCRCGPHVINTP